MAGNLSPAMLAECARTDRQVFVAISATLPSGTQWWGPEQPVASESEGWLLPILSQVGQYSIGADFRSFSVAREPKTVTIIDADRFFSTMDARGEPLAGSVLTSWFGSPRVPRADWLELHSGVLVPGWQGMPGQSYRLKIDAGAGWLNHRIGVPLTELAWPDANPEDYGKLIPICLGLWDASAGKLRGAVAPRRVSPTEYVFFGWLPSVDRVFQGASLMTGGGTHYDIDHPTGGDGLLYTRITFNTSPGSAEVRCDVHGLENVGDGSGAMVAGPAEQGVFILTNLCHTKHTGHVWGDGSNAPIDLTSWATVATALAKAVNGAPAVGAWLFTGDSLQAAPTGWWVMETLARCWGIGVHFNWASKVAAVIEDVHRHEYVSSPVLISSQVSPSSTFHRAEGWKSARRVSVRYGNSQTGQESVLAITDETGDQAGEEVHTMSTGGHASAR